MKRFIVAIVMGTAGFVGVEPARADSESWAEGFMGVAKDSDGPTARARVRVASLNPDEIETGDAPTRAKRTKVSAPEDRPQTRRTRVASLNASRSDATPERERPRRSLSGGSVNWTADAGCLNGTLRGIMRSLASSFGPVTVNSTCRSRSHNASVGGAPKSYHLQGEAVDFRVHGSVSAVYASLRDNGSVGVLKHYGGGLFHIDTGPRRSW